MTRITRLPAALAASLCTLALPFAAAAPVAAIDPGTGLAGGSNGYVLSGTTSNYTLGFRFAASQALHVTELGMFDFGGDGPGTNRQVGLFEVVGSTYTLLVSTHFLAAETATHRIGNYSYHDIADIDLLAGHNYAILASGYWGGDQNPLYFRSGTTLNGITYQTSVYNSTSNTSDAFAGPNYFSYEVGPQYYTYMGANFLFDNAAAGVPEPGGLALAGLALGLLAAVPRRAQRARASA